MTQPQLAEAIETTLDIVKAIESGRTKLPLEMIQRAGHATGTYWHPKDRTWYVSEGLRFILSNLKFKTLASPETHKMFIDLRTCRVPKDLRERGVAQMSERLQWMAEEFPPERWTDFCQRFDAAIRESFYALDPGRRDELTEDYKDEVLDDLTQKLHAAGEVAHRSMRPHGASPTTSKR